MMGQVQVADSILRELYKVWLTPQRREQVSALRAAVGGDASSFDRSLADLCSRKLVRYATNNSCEITPNGILYAERANLAPGDAKSRSQSARDAILDLLTSAYDERGLQGYTHYETMMAKSHMDVDTVFNTLQFFTEMGFSEPYYSATWRITPKGLDYNHRMRVRRSLVQDFGLISLKEPVAAEGAFQDWVARLVESEGWSQEETAKAANEERDVIISSGREYFMVESTRQKDPIDAPQVRDLYGKLEKRAGVNGVLVSMSGFTSDAAKEVLTHANCKLILLFGPGDVQPIVDGKSDLNDLLSAKCEALIKRGEVEYSN